MVELIHGGAAEAVEPTRDRGHRLRRLVRLHAAHEECPLHALGMLMERLHEPGVRVKEGHGAVEIHIDLGGGGECARKDPSLSIIEGARFGVDVGRRGGNKGRKRDQLILDGPRRERVDLVDASDHEEQTPEGRGLVPHVGRHREAQVGEVALHAVRGGLRVDLLHAIAKAEPRVRRLKILVGAASVVAEIRGIVHDVQHVRAGFRVLGEREEPIHIADIAGGDDEPLGCGHAFTRRSG